MRRPLVTAAVTLTLLAIAQPAAAAVRLVDGDGAATTTNCDAGAGGSAFTTIQAAVTAATAGADTIQVCPGTYAEKVTVNKALVINGPQAGVDARDASRGVPANEAIVTGSGAGVNVTTAFNVTSSDATIDGFTAQGQTSTADLGAEIVLAPDKANITIQNMIIQNASAGIFLGSDFTTIRHNVIRNNNQAGPTSGTAIYSDQFVAGGPQSGVTIEGNAISGNDNVGVLLFSTLEGSQSDFSITDNTIDGNGNAILVGNLSDSSFTRNVMTNPGGSAFVISKSVTNVLVAENFVTVGPTRGFRFFDSGVGTQADTDISFTCNHITQFQLSGLDVAAGVMGEMLDARFNFWGAASGPTIASNPSGTGQAIVDPESRVDYSSFLIDGADSDPATPGFQCVPRLSVADATVAEGNSGSSSLSFTVTLNNPAATPVSVVYATQDGSASAGSDYSPVADILTFEPGQTTKTVAVPVTGDGAVEPDETVALKLLNPSGATLADGSGTGTIQNDDSAAATPPPGGNPAADTRAPALTLKAIKAKLAKALKKGLAVSLRSDEAGTATVTVTAGGKVVAKGKATFTGPATKRITLKFTKKAKAKYAKAPKLKLALKASVKDAAGNTGTKSLKLTLSR